MKNDVPRRWSKKSITAPATNGPTEAIKRMTAMLIIQMTIGMSIIPIPGARAFMVVVMKLIPPSKKATISRKTARSHKDAPQLVRLYSAAADNGDKYRCRINNSIGGVEKTTTAGTLTVLDRT